MNFIKIELFNVFKFITFKFIILVLNVDFNNIFVCYAYYETFYVKIIVVLINLV